MSRKKDRPSARQRPPRPRDRERRAPQKRATQPAFVALFRLRAFSRGPLPWGPPAAAAGVRPARFRCWYCPPGKRALRRFLGWLQADPRRRPSWFALALTLVDCSPLRPLLPLPASERGERPFDPLSLLLVCLWKSDSGRPWDTLAAELAEPEAGAPWRARFGFSLHDTPAESTLRAFRHRLPAAFLDAVQALFLQTLAQAGLLPPAAPHGYLLAADGQLHQAHSAHRCHHAVAACYEAAPAGAKRACPARTATDGHYGCACDTPACQERCVLAPHLDPQAGFVVYTSKHRDKQGRLVERVDRAVFGYRSVATRLIDERFHHAWTVHTDLYAAPTDEGTVFAAHFAAAYAHLPEKQVAYVCYDSACGEQPALDAVYDVGAIPLFDLRADPSDTDTAACRTRGYDEHGHPFCPHGYPLDYQGLERRAQVRARWVCGHACRRAKTEVAECPWLKKKRGYHFYLTRCFRDGSYRLARLIPYGSRQWNKRTGWRNVTEGRNSALERRGLKRLPDYGHTHALFLIRGVDVVENLSTLARLVWEATSLDTGWVWPEEQEPGTLPESEAATAGENPDRGEEESADA